MREDLCGLLQGTEKKTLYCVQVACGTNKGWPPLRPKPLGRYKVVISWENSIVSGFVTPHFWEVYDWFFFGPFFLSVAAPPLPWLISPPYAMYICSCSACTNDELICLAVLECQATIESTTGCAVGVGTAQCSIFVRDGSELSKSFLYWLYPWAFPIYFFHIQLRCRLGNGGISNGGISSIAFHHACHLSAKKGFFYLLTLQNSMFLWLLWDSSVSSVPGEGRAGSGVFAIPFVMVDVTRRK